MAPVEKRLTISLAASTSSSGTGVRPVSSCHQYPEQAAYGLRARQSPRFTSFEYSPKV